MPTPTPASPEAECRRRTTAPAWLRDRLDALRRPAVRADVSLIVKAVLAAVTAWLVAVRVVDSSLPFLAPWTALLTVHATVYRSLTRGLESVASTVLGVLTAYVSATLLGVGPSGLALGLVVGLVASRCRFLRREGITVATTALFVLTSSQTADQVVLLERVGDVVLGVAIGVVVNVVAVPPLDTDTAASQLAQVEEAIADLIEAMCEELDDVQSPERASEWILDTRRIDDDLAAAWPSVRFAEETSWWNPRPSARLGRDQSGRLAEALRRLEDGVAELRAIAHTIDDSSAASHEWDPRFKQAWLEALREAGRRLRRPPATEEETSWHDDEVRTDPGRRLLELVESLSQEELPGLRWPVYGALVVDLRALIAAFEDARRIRSTQPTRPRRRHPRHRPGTRSSPRRRHPEGSCRTRPSHDTLAR